MAEEGQDRSAAAWARLLLADALGVRGDPVSAETLVAHVRATMAGDRIVEGYLHSIRGESALRRGDLEAARPHLEAGLARFDDEPGRYMAAHVGGTLALLDAVAGSADLAVARAEAGVEAARGLPGRQILVMALTRGSQAAVLSDRQERARSLLDELLGLLRALGGRRWVADALELTALTLGAPRARAAETLLGSAAALRAALREEGRILAALTERVAAASAANLALLGTAEAGVQRRRGAAMHLEVVLDQALSELRAVRSEPASGVGEQYGGEIDLDPQHG